MDMKETERKTLKVECPYGLQSRRAALLVKKANEYACSIRIEYHGYQMNVKSLLGTMSMNIVKGETVLLIAEGADAENAINALKEILAQPEI